MDRILASFISASDQTAAQEQLEAILAQVIPTIRKITARSRFPEDDLQESLKRIIQALWVCRESPEHHLIDDLIHYSSVVASHTCKERIRRQNPLRQNLSDSLRHLMKDGNSPFGIWKEDSGRQVCGYRIWTGRLSESSDKLYQLINPDPDYVVPDFQGVPAENPALSSIVEFIFTRLGHPLKFNDLVTIVFRLRGLSEVTFMRESESVESGYPAVTLADQSETPDETIEWREFLARVWEEIKALPHFQKIAYLLNFTTGSGEIEVFLKFGVAGLREIGGALQLTGEQFLRAWAELGLEKTASTLSSYDEKFALLWMHLPLKDMVIAVILDTDRQKVINLRKSAGERIARRMRG